MKILSLLLFLGLFIGFSYIKTNGTCNGINSIGQNEKRFLNDYKNINTRDLQKIAEKCDPSNKRCFKIGLEVLHRWSNGETYCAANTDDNTMNC